VALPFPDDAGAPVTQAVPPGPRSQALPFPNASTPPIRPAAAPQPDPALRALEGALSTTLPINP